jgi:hypothetical protein
VAQPPVPVVAGRLTFEFNARMVGIAFLVSRQYADALTAFGRQSLSNLTFCGSTSL